MPGILAFFLFGRILLNEEALVIKDVAGKDSAVVLTIDQKEKILHGKDALTELNVNTMQEARTLEGKTIQQAGKSITINKVVPPNVVITSSMNGTNQYLGADQFQTIVNADPISQKKTTLEEAKQENVIGKSKSDHGYGRLVRHVLPSWMVGFFAAVIVGAILSSFNSALNSTATLFSLGVYQHMIRPEASEAQVIRAGKWFGWIIAIAAMSTAPLLMGQESIFGYLQKMNGLYFIPIFSVVVMGLLHRRVPAPAANTALVLGFTAIVLGYFVPPLRIGLERFTSSIFWGWCLLH